MHQLAGAGWHLVAIGYAVFIACSTVLPTSTQSWFLALDIEKLATPYSVGKVVLLSAFVGAVMLAVVAWRRRDVWMSRLSPSLLAYVIVCGIGLAMLVLISQPPRYLARLGLGELRSVVAELDVRHMISYFGFAVVAAIAWRGRVSLPVLGALLMAYGYCLELVQIWVPTRALRLKDLISNGLGILLGLCWVYLYDSLFGEGTRLSRLAGGRRRRARARRNEAPPSIQPHRS
jgi:hypothetical protein